MKKILFFLVLSSCLMVGLVACSGSGSSNAFVKPALISNIDRPSDLLHLNSAYIAPVKSGPGVSLDATRLAALSKDVSDAFKADSELEILDESSQADAKLYTTVLRYTEREGSRVGAEQGAVVNIEMRLLRGSDSKEIWHAHYFYKDEALSDNLFRIGERMSRGRHQGWLSAQEIARLGFSSGAEDLAKRRAGEFSAEKK